MASARSRFDGLRRSSLCPNITTGVSERLKPWHRAPGAAGVRVWPLMSRLTGTSGGATRRTAFVLTMLVGLMLVAPYFREDTLIQAAAAYQQSVDCAALISAPRAGA